MNSGSLPLNLSHAGARPSRKLSTACCVAVAVGVFPPPIISIGTLLTDSTSTVASIRGDTGRLLSLLNTARFFSYMRISRELVVLGGHARFEMSDNLPPARQTPHPSPTPTPTRARVRVRVSCGSVGSGKQFCRPVDGHPPPLGCRRKTQTQYSTAVASAVRCFPPLIRFTLLSPLSYPRNIVYQHQAQLRFLPHVRYLPPAIHPHVPPRVLHTHLVAFLACGRCLCWASGCAPQHRCIYR